MMKNFLLKLLTVALISLYSGISSAQWTSAYSSTGSYVWDFDQEGTTIIAPDVNATEIIKSTDNGLTWSTVANLSSIAPCFSVAIEAISIQGNYMYAGELYSFVPSCYNPLYVSNNFGATWIPVSTIPDTINVHIIESNSNYLFLGSDQTIWRSNDHGNSWLEVTWGFPSSNVWPTDFLISGDTIYATTNLWGVYMSANNGNSWQAINNGLVGNSFGEIIRDSNNLYVIGGNSIYKSSNFGASWTPVNSPSVSGNNKSLATRGNDLFISKSGSGIYHSSNGGATWQAVNSGLGSLNVDKLFIAGYNLIAGYDNGISVYQNAVCDASYDTISVVACNFYTSSGNHTYFVSGIYNDTLQNSVGCDSIITMNVTINPPPVNLTISGPLVFCQGDSVVLSVPSTLSSYQWYNLSYAIPGATSFDFIADNAGTYYCIASDSTGCSDTSSIVIVKVPCIGIGPNQLRPQTEDFQAEEFVNVFPNPSGGNINVTSSPGILQISNTTGQVIYEKFGSADIDINIELPAGFYFISIKSKTKTVIEKILVH